jgi:hypothetical protein
MVIKLFVKKPTYLHLTTTDSSTKRLIPKYNVWLPVFKACQSFLCLAQLLCVLFNDAVNFLNYMECVTDYSFER